MQSTRRILVQGFREDAPPLAAVRMLLDWLAEGIDRALRLRIEGRSVALGPRPKWALASQVVRVERLNRGSIDLALSSPSVGDLMALHPVWAQPNLFLSRPDPAQTPVDLFADSVRDAARGHDDADTLDVPLLAHIATASDLLGADAEAVLFQTEAKGEATAILRREDVQQIVAMAARAPSTRRVRLLGELDTVSVSTGAFILFVDGNPLRGVMAPMRPSDARDLLGTRVLAEGDLVYRPSGRPLRLDASGMRLATDQDRGWEHLPTTVRPRRAEAARPPGFDDIFEGLEPDDSDEDEALTLRTDDHAASQLA